MKSHLILFPWLCLESFLHFRVELWSTVDRFSPTNRARKPPERKAPVHTPMTIPTESVLKPEYVILSRIPRTLGFLTNHNAAQCFCPLNDNKYFDPPTYSLIIHPAKTKCCYTGQNNITNTSSPSIWHKSDISVWWITLGGTVRMFAHKA